MTKILRFIGLTFLNALITTGVQGQTLNRCIQGNEVVLQNRPCNSPSQSLTSSDNATSYGTKPRQPGSLGLFQGNWQGEAQFQATTEGNIIPEAHAVGKIVLNVEDRGKITGQSIVNGCRLLGLVTPGTSPTQLALDVTLSKCRHPSLDGRVTGYLTYDFKTTLARMTLNGMSYSTLGSTVVVEITSLLKKN